jgi:peptidoglycan/LPS O-acetylase OafA/YrhL
VLVGDRIPQQPEASAVQEGFRHGPRAAHCGARKKIATPNVPHRNVNQRLARNRHRQYADAPARNKGIAPVVIKTDESSVPANSGAVEPDRKAVSKRGFFIPRLEAFRGYGCVMVAMVHCAQTSTSEGVTLLDSDRGALSQWSFRLYAVLFNGNAALTMFFVLSGFLLFLSLERGHQQIRYAGVQFFSMRVLRLFPPIWTNLAVFWGLFAFFGITVASPKLFEPISLLRNAMLLETSINGAMWTLQLEALAIPLIFGGYFAYRRFGNRSLLILLAGLIAIAFSKRWLTPLGIGPAPIVLLHTFAFGMLVPTLGQTIVKRLSRQQAAITMAIATGVFLSIHQFSGYWSTRTLVIEAATGFILATGIAYRGDLAIFRPLDWRIAHFYGRISYSFYLLHPLALIAINHVAVAPWLAMGIPPVIIALFFSLASTLVITPLAYLCYRTVEVPGIRFGVKIAKAVAATTRPPQSHLDLAHG